MQDEANQFFCQDSGARNIGEIFTLSLLSFTKPAG